MKLNADLKAILQMCFELLAVIGLIALGKAIFLQTEMVTVCYMFFTITVGVRFILLK